MLDGRLVITRLGSESDQLIRLGRSVVVGRGCRRLGTFGDRSSLAGIRSASDGEPILTDPYAETQPRRYIISYLCGIMLVALTL